MLYWTMWLLGLLYNIHRHLVVSFILFERKGSVIKKRNEIKYFQFSVSSYLTYTLWNVKKKSCHSVTRDYSNARCSVFVINDEWVIFQNNNFSVLLALHQLRFSSYISPGPLKRRSLATKWSTDSATAAACKCAIFWNMKLFFYIFLPFFQPFFI